MSSISGVSGSSSQAGSLLAPKITVSGLASGLDSDRIVEGLLAPHQQHIARLQARRDRLTQQQSAFKAIEARLLAFQGRVTQLARSQSGAFDVRTAASSDDNLLTAAASASAAPGVYTFKVNALASAHQVASQGYASPATAITQGTLELRSGPGAPVAITIDGTNNTLSGLAAAINSAGAGVRAAVINDGSGAEPYRLLLTAEKTGAANAITITNNLALDAGGAVRPALTTTVQAAADASVTLGTGAGALTVFSAKNDLDGVIPGLTLSLRGADSARAVTVTVAADTKKAGDTILDFVQTFNDLMEFIDEQVRFDPATGKAGPLQADRQATAIQDLLRGALSGSVAGLGPKMNRLGALGITFNERGRLSVNQAKLEDALAGRVPGVGLQDVRGVFALWGASTNPGVQFVTASVRTKASAAPYQVDLTQAAEQGKITAGNALDGSTVIDASNNTFTLTVDGAASSTVVLSPGTYTPQALARQVQDQVNADPALLGRQVTVGLDGGKLVITSATYGTASQVVLGAGTALAVLGFVGGESGQGRDVVGKFIVNGKDEPAVGTGQFLVGNAANAHTGDLQVRVTLTPTQVAAGPDAELTVTRGLASVAEVALNALLDPVSGRLKTIDGGLQTTLDGLKAQAEKQAALMESRRAGLLRQFVAMEQAVSQLQTAGNYLLGQLNYLNQQRRANS